MKFECLCSIERKVSIQENYYTPRRLFTYFFLKNVFDIQLLENCIITKGRIIIGNDVYIGAGSTILLGVKVGNGAIIAANAVVTKNIPAYGVVAGNPAKLIKYRFSEDSIKKFEQMEWWNWPIDKLKQQKEIFLREYE